MEVPRGCQTVLGLFRFFLACFIFRQLFSVCRENRKGAEGRDAPRGLTTLLRLIVLIKPYAPPACSGRLAEGSCQFWMAQGISGSRDGPRIQCLGERLVGRQVYGDNIHAAGGHASRTDRVTARKQREGPRDMPKAGRALSACFGLNRKIVPVDTG